MSLGQPRTLEAPSPAGDRSIVFEDDGDVGYLYAVGRPGGATVVLDALQIYAVTNRSGGVIPSLLQLIWSSDGRSAMLLLDGNPQAVVDFQAHRGYCRLGFPPADRTWSTNSHEWDDQALKPFR